MTKKQFKTALIALDCSKNGASDLLGIARSTVYRILAGDTEVPLYVEKLLVMYLRYGVPAGK
jgi:hypothetical protein